MSVQLKICAWLCAGLTAIAAGETASWGKPPEVKYFFPAGAQIGSEVTVTATGEFPDWPVEGVSEPAGLEFTAGEEKGKLQLRVPSDVLPGTYLVRLTSAAGVSGWKPLVIGRRPEGTEVEPNNTIEASQSLEDSSIVVNGVLAERQDVDIFSVSLSQGATLVASLLGNETLGSPMDAVLQICDERGFVLQQNDDERGLDPQLVFVAPSEGRYHIRIFAFPAAPNSSIAFSSSADYIYRLTLSTGPFVDHSLPLAVTQAEEGATVSVQAAGWNLDQLEPLLTTTAPAMGTTGKASLVLASPELADSVRIPVVNYPSLLAAPLDASGQPQEVSLPVVISGRIESPGGADVVRFTAEKGDKIVVQVESRSLGFTLDPVARISSTDGKKLAEMDDASRTDRDVTLNFTVPEDGAYDLSIRDLHGHAGLRYSYRATISQETPSYSLSTPNDALVVKRGESVDLPIDINRRNGFAEAIEFVTGELPDGIAWEAAISEVTAGSSGENENQQERGQRRRRGRNAGRGSDNAGADDVSRKVTARVTADCEPGHYRIHVLGKTSEEDPAVALRFRTAGVDHDDVWITVLP